MRLSTAVSFALAALLVASVLGAAAATPVLGPAADADRSAAPADRLDAQSAAPPEQVVRIAMSSTGSAEWTVESRFSIDPDDGAFNDTDSFRAFAAAVAAGERDVGYDAGTYERYATLAEESAGREMSILDAGWNDARVERWPAENAAENETVGVVSFTFRWTNFARTDENRIYLGDAFGTDGDPWFGGLTADQRLVIEPPANYGYVPSSIPRLPDDGALVWDGPYEFGDDEIRVTYLRGADTPESSPTETDPSPTETAPPPTDPSPTETDPSPTETDEPGGPLSSNFVWFGLVALLLFVGGGGYYLARTDGPDAGGSDGDSTAPGAAAASTETADAAAKTVQTAGTAETDDAAAVTSFDEDEVADDVDVELLSDEERVGRLLRRNDGRMKQATIVKETGWSNAKVSQLLSEMDDDDEIEKLRIGRENLITLPEVDPTEVD